MAMFDRFFAGLRAFLGEPLAKSLRRRLRAASPATLSELREGLHCRIAGTARAIEGDALTAPLSGLRCLGYLLEVIATEVGVGDRLLVYDKKAVPFVLEEGDHRAVIDPMYVELLVAPAHELRAYAFREDPQQRAILARYCPHETLLATTSIRYRELVIEPGMRITIAGTGHREVDPHAQAERGFRDEAQQRLRFVGAPGLPLLIGDDPP